MNTVSKKSGSIASILIGPIPVVVIFVIVCLWVLLSPIKIINGQPDDAPRGAAILGLFLTPIVYMFMVGALSLQIKSVNKLAQPRLLNHIFGCLISAFLISGVFAYAIYEPKFNESLALTWLVSFLAWCLLMCLMTLLWWAVNKKNEKSSRASLNYHIR